MGLVDGPTDRQTGIAQEQGRWVEARQGEASPSLKINNIKAGSNWEAAAKAQSKQRKRKKREEEKRSESCVVEKSRGKRLKTNERSRAEPALASTKLQGATAHPGDWESKVWITISVWLSIEVLCQVASKSFSDYWQKSLTHLHITSCVNRTRHISGFLSCPS